MGKRILGLFKYTNNEVIQGELGWWTLKSRREMLRLRFWWKLLDMSNERLPRRVYEWELRQIRKDSSWTSYTKRVLFSLGLEKEWQRQEVEESYMEWGEKVKTKILEREQERWWNRVQSSDKLRTYRKIKQKLAFGGISDETGWKGKERIS